MIRQYDELALLLVCLSTECSRLNNSQNNRYCQFDTADESMHLFFKLSSVFSSAAHWLLYFFIFFIFSLAHWWPPARVVTKNCIIPGSRPARGPLLRPFPIALLSFPVLSLYMSSSLPCSLSAVVIYIFLTCCVLPLKSITSGTRWTPLPPHSRHLEHLLYCNACPNEWWMAACVV